MVFAISAVSGYPVGARLASDLRLNKDISQYEGQRLVSFCSTSGPLFIIGAVAVGMLNNASLGYVMLICHYLGAITVGLLFRKYGHEKRQISNKSIITLIIDSSNVLATAITKSIFSKTLSIIFKILVTIK